MNFVEYYIWFGGGQQWKIVMFPFHELSVTFFSISSFMMFYKG